MHVVTRFYLNAYGGIRDDGTAITPGPVDGESQDVLTKSANFTVNASQITRAGVELAN